MSYPVLNFRTTAADKSSTEIKWYPSEYLFRDSNTRYCMGLEKFGRTNEILMGGTFMRQYNYIFDVEKSQVGVARARCSDDPYQIVDETEMVAAG